MTILKKLFSAVVSVMVLTGATFFAASLGSEMGNNLRCVDAAKRIGEIEGVDTVAVVKMGGKIIAGIRSDADQTDKILMYSKSILEGLFPASEGCRVEVENQLAQKIIELSYFADGDMDKSVLEGRFNFLWSI